MKIININFLGTEYKIQCEDHEISKIKNLEARLNNRVKLHTKEKHNFTDTHKLLIVTLSLEDKINDLLINQKKLVNLNNNLNEKNKDLSKNIIFKDNLKNSLELISEKIKIILTKISSDNYE
tara:strand:- start:116 stop:481 length:366 start_codon:yes stop_codon:yes gene_type:complete